MIRRAALPVTFVVLILTQPGWASAKDEPKSAQSTGAAAKADDSGLLPNGWRLTPAGRQVLLTDLPLNLITSADGKYALVATSGYNAHELTGIELATGKKTAVETVNQSWFGIAFD